MKLPLTPLLLLAPLTAAQQTRLSSPPPPESVAFANPIERELAGKPLPAFPHFQFTRTFNQGDTVRIAFDPKSDPSLQKRTIDVYLIEHEDLLAHLTGRKLRSVLGRPLTIKLGQEGVQENTFVLDTGRLAATSRPDAEGTYQLGKGYDVVVDMNVNAGLDAGDLIDGSLDEAGFYVVEDFVTFNGAGTKTTGPYAVTEVLFDGGTNFTQEDIYFPSTIGALGELPLIVVSHGNGHNDQWYDHLGYHMASWGYVVMSHANNTGPGIETASTSTLRNTEVFLANLGNIAGGALAGHVDGHRIVWIGHSRGGEGVTRAHKRLADGSPIATLYTLEDIRLVSSIAPTDFLGPNVSDVGAVPYHLWTGGADADVNGCADCDICQTFHLLERADAARFSLSLHGAGHGDFHDGGGSSVASGPRQIKRKLTHQIMRAYFLPLVQYNLHGNPACLDYLTRQWEEFRALGAPYPGRGEDPEDEFVVADLMFVPHTNRYVVDDFQSQPALTSSSSGGAVQASAGLLPTLIEGLQNDANNAFTNNDIDSMNGMTFAGPGDSARGAVLEWNGTDEWLSFEVPAGNRDLSAFRTLSFRAAQTTRDTITVLEEVDLDFTVELTDAGLKSSAIRIGTYGGGIEEPYQRASCGTGRGWANEFETIRIALGDFRRDGTPLDLSNVVAITFRFGPSHGSSAGRIGLDELLFSAE
jgi:hypothetical protein